METCDVVLNVLVISVFVGILPTLLFIDEYMDKVNAKKGSIPWYGDNT